MRKLILFCLSWICVLGTVNAAPTPEHVAQIEKTLSAWLAEPSQLGAAPKRVKYLASVATKAPGGAATEVHVVEYLMGDGTYGKGFVHPVTMSFGPLPYEKLSHEQLVTAYTGWLLLAAGLEGKSIVTDFQPKTAEALKRELQAKGLRNIIIKEKYRIDTSEIFEFEAKKGNKKFLGAGEAGAAVLFQEGAPETALPVVYTFLGKLQRGEL